MTIENIKTISGPNVYSHNPVLVMTLDLEELAGKESYEIPGFNERLLHMLPGIVEHHCGLGRRGGFVERLEGGTWFGHIVEHVALELTDALDISVNRGKTVSAGRPGVFLVAVEYRSEQGMRYLLRVAVDLVQALVRGEAFELEPKLKEGRAIVQRTGFGPSTLAVIAAAERRNIPWQAVGSGSLVRLGYGCRARMIEATISSNTSAIAVDIASDKDLTKRILAAAGLPVPKGAVVYSESEACDTLSDLGPPVVIKPLDGNQGRGVSLNVRTREDVAAAFRAAREHSESVLVEEMYTGRDYRVMVVDGRLVAASEKRPARVEGDGQHTIAQLITIANSDPRRAANHSSALSPIACDAVAEELLKRSGRSWETVPAAGEVVYLRESANLSTGGDARDVTDLVHEDVAIMCERAARTIGLDICGLDIVLPDIAEPVGGRGGIIEVNAAPGIRMHHHPAEGEVRDVGAAIVDSLFPDSSDGRIPLVTITGTNGKTTVTRMITNVFCHAGKVTGMTTTDGIVINSRIVATGDMTGPWSARVVLNDPTVEVAILETARGGIMRSGLGYDWSDVGVFTNIQADHLGQDGIENVDDILDVKRLVAERVREGGTLVLNADDERLLKMASHPRVAKLDRKIVYYSLDFANEVVQAHIEAGGTAYLVKGDWIEEHRGRVSRRLMRTSAVPATFGGTAGFQVANVLACVAACRAMNVPHDILAQSMMAFDNQSANVGRANVYEFRGGFVVLDYGHNPHAIEAVGNMLARWGMGRKTVVLGLPGDRCDDLIAESARVSARCFDSVIVREDLDTRGRARGETADLIARFVHEERRTREVRVILDELEAVAAGAHSLQPHEVLVCFCDRTSAVAEWLMENGAKPCANPMSIAREFQELSEVSA